MVIFLDGVRQRSSGGRGESAFRFEASWLSEEMCSSIVSDAWVDGGVLGEGSVVEKLKTLPAACNLGT